MVGLMSLGVVDQQEWRKGPWTTDEDKLLSQYVSLHGEGRWSSVAKCTGLNRSGKSCRLRWVNYLRPGLKKGQITPQEEGIIIELHALWGNKWSTIARYLPGRTDNEIKNYWRTHFKRKPKPSPKLAKRRNQILQQKKHQLLLQQQQQQQLQEDHSDMINKIIPKTKDVMTETQAKQEIASMYSTLEDHDDCYFPLMYNHQHASEPPSWSETTIEDGLWGDLWNLDDPQGGNRESRGCEFTKISIPNQTNAFSCGGSNGPNWYNGGDYIF